jgi:amino acid transporter
MLGLQIMSLGVTFYFVTTISGLWPGSYLPLAFLIILPFVVIHSLTSSMMTMALPRSGGSYVWASRVINPPLSFASQGVITVYDALLHGGFVQLIVSGALATGLLSLGLSTGNSDMVNLSNTFGQPALQFGLGTLIMLVIAFVAIRGMGFSLRAQTVAYVVGMIGVVAAVLLVFGITPDQFTSKFNAIFASQGGTAGITAAATKAGYVSTPFSLFATFATMISVWWLLSGYEMQQFLGGEIKSVKKTMLIGTIGACIIGCFVNGIFVIGLQNAMTPDFYNAASYLAASGGWTLSVPFSGWFLAILFASPLISILLIAALALWLFAVVMAGVLWHSRCVLAWSWDRIIPTKFSDVSDKYHVPVWAIVLMVLIPEVGLVLSIYYGAVILVINATLGWVLFYTLEGLAAMLFPKVQKSIYESSPIKRNIGPVPLISIFGAITAFFFIWAGYMSFVAYPFVGGLNTAILEIYVGLLVVFLAIYYLSKGYHAKKDGIDIGLAFKQIPPE